MNEDDKAWLNVDRFNQIFYQNDERAQTGDKTTRAQKKRIGVKQGKWEALETRVEWRPKHPEKGYPPNISECDIYIEGIDDFSHFDCLVFQNSYTSELSLHQIGKALPPALAKMAADKAKSPGIENKGEDNSDRTILQSKCLIKSYRLVNSPNYENDQQSWFAIYKSGFDTTDYLTARQTNPATGKPYLRMRARLQQESPIWNKCLIKNVTAYRFHEEFRLSPRKASISPSKNNLLTPTCSPLKGSSDNNLFAPHGSLRLGSSHGYSGNNSGNKSLPSSPTKLLHGDNTPSRAGGNNENYPPSSPYAGMRSKNQQAKNFYPNARGKNANAHKKPIDFLKFPRMFKQYAEAKQPRYQIEHKYQKNGVVEPITAVQLSREFNRK